MSEQEREIDPVLRSLVDEAREHMDPTRVEAGRSFDWDRVEAGVMRRVEAEQQIERLGGPRGLWGGVAAAFAAAAAAALLLGRAPADPSIDPPPVAQAPLEASDLAARQGSGEVRINGQSVPTGHALRFGDTVEVRGARAIFDRPGKVTWTVEEAQLPAQRETISPRVVVKSAQTSTSPLILALEHGAIEAEVTPVAQGEAFAVDVGELRVAVHGTHLRVARAGNSVVVDLTEGVISVGRAPRFGSTYGRLVTAPARVELDLGDVDGTFKVDHTKDSVRPASPLRELAGSVSRQASAAAVAAEATVHAPASAARAATPPKRDRGGDSALAPAPGADPNPQETIVHALKVCAHAKPAPAGVSMTMASTLQLKIRDDGSVESARFDPPLSPEVQTCASTTIYKTRFAQPGWVRIPFELQK